MTGTAFGVITVDGPAGVGKSTLARRLAATLGIAYLDTGAMYRTLGLRLGAEAADMDEANLRARCREYRFSLEAGRSGESPQLCCNGEPVGPEIRTERAGRLASLVARLPVLREELQRAQRALGGTYSLVAEGRDMGTRVFPEARHKFFLDARPEVRARRRYLELEARGTLNGLTLEEILRGIEERDAQDRGRAVDPLRPAEDAVLVDTSDLDLDGVMQVLLNAVKKRRDEGGQEKTVPPVRARAEMRIPADVLRSCDVETCLASAREEALSAARSAVQRHGGGAEAKIDCRVVNGIFEAEAETAPGASAGTIALACVQAAVSGMAEELALREADVHLVLPEGFPGA